MATDSALIKIKLFTKERVVRHSKRMKMTQGDFIELCLDVAEKANFINEYPTEHLLKFQRGETNRIIGFLKVQDKNMIQIEQNIYHFLKSNSTNNVEEFLKILEKKLKNRIHYEIQDRKQAERTFERIYFMISEIKKEYDLSKSQ